MFKFDTTIDPAAGGGIEKPTLMWSQPVSGVGDRPLGHVQL